MQPPKSLSHHSTILGRVGFGMVEGASRKVRRGPLGDAVKDEFMPMLLGTGQANAKQRVAYTSDLFLRLHDDELVRNHVSGTSLSLGRQLPRQVLMSST